MKHLANLALTLACSVSPAAQASLCSNWTTTDTALTVAALIPTAIDYSQTKRIARQEVRGPDGLPLFERNPLLPRQPSTGQVDRHFVGAVLLGGVLACTLTPEYRRVMLGTVVALEIGVVLHNRSNGLTLKLNF